MGLCTLILLVWRIFFKKKLHFLILLVQTQDLLKLIGLKGVTLPTAWAVFFFDNPTTPSYLVIKMRIFVLKVPKSICCEVFHISINTGLYFNLKTKHLLNFHVQKSTEISLLYVHINSRTIEN
jgi:hypothetical protein